MKNQGKKPLFKLQDLSPQEKRKYERSHLIQEFEDSIKTDIQAAFSTSKRSPDQRSEASIKPTVKKQVKMLNTQTNNIEKYNLPDSDAPHVSFNNPSIPSPKHASAIPKKSNRKRTGFSDSSGVISDPIFSDDDLRNEDNQQNHEENESSTNDERNENEIGQKSDDSNESEQNSQNNNQEVQEEEEEENEDDHLSQDSDDNKHPLSNKNDEEEEEEEEAAEPIQNSHKNITSSNPIPSDDDDDDNDNDLNQSSENEDDDDNGVDFHNANEDSDNDDENDDDDDSDEDDDNGAAILLGGNQNSDSSDEPYEVEAVTDTRKNEIRNNRKQRNVF